jgi:dimethylhistidine N-methyltransferase
MIGKRYERLFESSIVLPANALRQARLAGEYANLHRQLSSKIGNHMHAQLLEPVLLDQEPSSDSFLNEVLLGLQQFPKTLPCKYFYDERGSRLFDQICDLDEYYVMRTEQAIMDAHAPEMAAQIGPGVMLVEYGSGSSVKTRILLEHLPEVAAYVPVDISGKHLQHTCRNLARCYPALEVLPVCADFTTDFDLPMPQRAPTHCAVYFPGSTIGNFGRDEAEELLSRIAPLCGTGGGLLIGIDLPKDRETLEAAYNDSRGITADFNLNLLRRINRELSGDFGLDKFRHVATYNADQSRIEIFLQSLCDQVVTVAGKAFRIAANELICTEHSHKYTVDGFARTAAKAGLTLRKQWTDDEQRFAVLHFAIVD